MDKHHCKVITLFCGANIRGNRIFHIMKLSGGGIPATKGFHHPFFAEQLFVLVFCLCKSVSIKEHGVIEAHVKLLLRELHSRHNTKRQIGLYVKRFYISSKEYRRIMSCIAVFNMAGCKVQNAAEEGYEHIVLVDIRHTVIHVHDNTGRTALMGGYVTEQASSHGHHQ